MPVTIRPASHGAKSIRMGFEPAGNAFELLEQISVKNKNILDSSFQDITNDSNIYGLANGFVDGAIDAYSGHHHLEIRPDDVWFAILAQLNIFINANSENLRGIFVDHEGQVELTIDIDGEVRGDGAYNVDWAKVSMKMADLIDSKIKSRIRDWVIPHFSTTTNTDRAVASIFMMSVVQEYLNYAFQLRCGLPSVTLLGEKSDWERLEGLAEELWVFGAEPELWYSLLKPVLARFVASFDAPEAEKTKDFWQKIAHHSHGGSGAILLSSWITAFCFWDVKGNCKYKDENIITQDTIQYDRDEIPFLQLDDVKYHHIEISEIPPGLASVPIKVVGVGTHPPTDINRTMTAGLVGIRFRSSPQPVACSESDTNELNFIEMEVDEEDSEEDSEGDSEEDEHDDDTLKLDTISIESGWWMYESITQEEIKSAADA